MLATCGMLPAVLGASRQAACCAVARSVRCLSSEATHTSVYANEAMELLDLPQGLERLILSPDRELSVELTVPMSNGEISLFRAHRVQHNNSRGPYKGGIVFHPDLTITDLRSLASLNTWKTAFLNIPFGGSKGGIACDPTSMTERELEKVTRKMVQGMKSILGPFDDIPAPDIGTDERCMAWIFDEYSKYKGYSPAAVTGKPYHLHGTLGRDSAPGRGVAVATREFLKNIMYTKLAGSTFVVQGFGKLGGWAAHALHAAGGKVVAVCDAHAGICNERGLDLPSLRAHLATGGRLNDFTGGLPISPGPDFLEFPCDILVPAAVGSVINEGNVHRLNCKAIVEAANSAITPDADKALRSRGIPVLPDIVANSGGIVVSFLEWVQNLQNFKWDEEEINRRMDGYISDAFASMHAVSTAGKLPLRTAGYKLAVQRVVQAERNRGFD